MLYLRLGRQRRIVQPGIGRPSLSRSCSPGSVARADRLLSSTETDSVLRYDAATGAFRGAFVAAGSGGLDQPRRLGLGPHGNLYVASFMSDQVLCYDGATGAFLEVFVDAGSGGLDGPHHLAFGPDGTTSAPSTSTPLTLRRPA